MELSLAYYGNPILRKKAKPIEVITDEIRELVKEMKTMAEKINGIGLAAPQVGHSIALFITLIPKDKNSDDQPGELKVFINPRIISYHEKTWTCQEGCLSIPEFWDDVERPFSVVMEAMDLDGNLFQEEFTELDAHVVLHENDHLNGVLFIDRLHPKRKKEIDPTLKRIKKKYAN